MRFLLPISAALVAGEAVLASASGNLRNSPKKRVGTSPQQDMLLDDVMLPHVEAIFHPFKTTRRGEDPVLSPVDPFSPRRLNEPLEEEEYQRRMEGRAGEPPVSEFPGEEEEEDEEDQEIPASKQPPWPHEMSDIPLDPAIRYGELDNGMRYMVRSNPEPPGKMEFRLHIDAGANFEDEPERGMAHFLEHMMFQTTQHFPVPGELVPTFQRLGIGFGLHLNAYTNLEETVYFLALANTGNESMTVGFNWMQDIMGGALLEDVEIEAERGVVVSELQLRDSVNSRLSRELYSWLIPDSLVSKRWVIGTEETIEAMTREMFVDYYKKYYVPRRATFMAVGDMDADELVVMIEEAFSGLQDTGDRGAEADYGTAPEGLGMRTNVLLDEEFVGNQVSMNNIRNAEFVPDTVDNRIKSMTRSMANGILSERLDELGTQEGSPIQYGYASSSNLFDFARVTTVTVVPKEEQWRESVAVLEQEWRRVMEYGFTQFEVDRAKSRTLNSYEQSVLSKDARRSAQLIGTLNGAVNGKYVVSTPEESLRVAMMALETMTAESLWEEFRSHWNTTDINIFLATSEINGTVEEIAQEIADLFLQSQEVEIDPPEEKEPVIWNYTDFGPPGTVVSDNFVEDLEIRQLVLSNNVRVNMKQTDFSPGRISFRARFGTGKLSQPKNATYLDEFSRFVFANSALGAHDIFELRTALAGKTAGFFFSIGQGDFAFFGGSNQRDLPLALQLMTAHFTDPGFREDVVGWWQADIPALLESLKFSLGGTYSFELFSWLLGGDERFIAPTEEELMAFVASDASDWLMPFLNSSYIEFSIIGDFNETSTLDYILETLGALPQREDAPAEVLDEERAINIPEPQANSFTYPSKLPQAGAFVAWEVPSDVSLDVELVRKMNVLSSIFRDRMRIKIREEMGGAYSPGASSIRSSEFDYGFLMASSEGLPEEVEVFTDIILGIAGNISTGDISEDEFERALVPFQSRLQDTLRDNGYWLNVMDRSQAQPFRLDWSRGRDEFYEAMTVDEINALAMEYLSPELAYPLSIFPVNLTDVEEA